MDPVIKYKYMPLLRHSGFTLIELMITLVISSLVILGVYTTFISQNKSYVLQERVVEMQQTLRTVLMMMGRDIRMAGYYNHDKLNDSDPDIIKSFIKLKATHNNFEFQYDRNITGNVDGSLDTNEDFKYELYPTTDSNPTKLHSMSGGNAIAYDISALGFAYAYDADGDGYNDTDVGEIIWAVPNGGYWFDLDSDNDGDIDIDDKEGGEDTTTLVDTADIRMVRVWVLVRSSRTDQSYSNKNTYVVGSVHFKANDHYRRKLRTTIIRLRNIGL